MSGSRDFITSLGVSIHEPRTEREVEGTKRWSDKDLDLIAGVFRKLGIDQRVLNGTVIKRVTTLEEKAPPQTTPKTTKPTKVWHTAATFVINVFTISDLAEARDIAHECGHAVANHGARVAFVEYTKMRGLDEVARDRLKAANTAGVEANTKHREAVEAYNKLDTALTEAATTKQPTDVLSKAHQKAYALVNSCAEQDEACQKEYRERKKEQEATKAALDRATEDYDRIKGTSMTARVAKFFAFVIAKEIKPGITAYASSTWPAKPEEFYAEAYAEWIMDQEKLMKHSKELFEWFKTGSYRSD